MTDGSPYDIAAELKPGTTWRVTDATGRQLVLKQVPPDCLRQGQLHPAVRDRLARFRELPLMSFAALIGVERFGDTVVTVSEYIEGNPLINQCAADQVRLVKALRHAIAALHGLGLVHGRLHRGNIVVDCHGQLRVIDPSPLLHDDPAEDLAALDLIDPPTLQTIEKPAADEPPIRRDTLRAAAIVAAVGTLAAVSVLAWFWRSA